MKYVPKQLKETSDISRGRGGFEAAVKLVLSAAVLLGGLYLLLGFAADLLASYIPDRVEQAIFGRSQPSEDPDSGDSAAAERVERVFKKLKRAGSSRSLDYRIAIIEMPQPNAFAFPGGLVAVTSGLLEQVEGEAGLAMVLAHELGHHEGRHTLSRLGRLLLWQLLKGSVLGMGSSTAMDMADRIAALHYSRDQEQEADRFGLELVFRAYGTTDGALEFFERVMMDAGAGAGGWGELISTHPLTRKRLDELRELARKLGEANPS